MSQPTGSSPSNVPLRPLELEERVTILPVEDAVESFFSEPTDLRVRLADAASPPLAPAEGLLTYEPYYGLKEKAFSLSTDPRFLYKSGSHAPVFHDLLWAIRRREGLIVLTGDIGAGKTTLCRAVLGELDRKTFATFVPDPFVSREDLLKMLLVEFGVVSIEDVRRGRLKGASRVELSYPLYEFLKSLGPLDAFAVLVIDEAQDLALPLLEEIRILSDLEDGRKLLQVVLVGQPEFRAHLKLPRMRQVDQRVSLRCELRPLTREGISNYVAHRLSMAGGSTDRVAFSPSSLDLVFEASGGIPRVINLICDRALEQGYRSQASSIGPGLVAAAIRDLQLGTSSEDDSIEEVIALPKESVSLPPAEERASAPMAAPSPRGLFENQPAASETPARTSDLDVLLHLAPTPTRVGSAPLPDSSEVMPNLVTGEMAPTSKSVEFAKDVRRGRAVRLGLLSTMALAVIGALTGVSLVGYLLWMRPLLAERPPVPPGAPVKAPDVRRVNPLILAPSTSPRAQDPKVVATEPTASRAEPTAARGRWAVQVAAFASGARVSALVRRLSEAGFQAYESQGFGRQGLRLVLVGPYVTTAEAESVRAQIRQLPDLDGALLRNLETGKNF